MEGMANHTEPSTLHEATESTVIEAEQVQPKPVEPPRILGTLVVEEISIDGMCGIY
jgi:mycofactocin precursor